MPEHAPMAADLGDYDAGSLEKNNSALRNAAQREWRMAWHGLFGGVIAVFVGTLLLVLGIPGVSGVEVSVLGLDINLTHALPGVGVAVLGLVIVWSRRFGVHFDASRYEQAVIDEALDLQEKYANSGLWAGLIYLLLAVPIGLAGLDQAADFRAVFPEWMSTRMEMSGAPPALIIPGVGTLIIVMTRMKVKLRS